MNTPKSTPEINELILAFESYDFIVTQTDPFTGQLYTDKLTIPSYIKNQVEKFETKSFSRTLDSRHPRKYLPSYAVNELLLELIREDMPLYSVAGKEISCVSDIQSLYKEIETGIDSCLRFFKDSPLFDRERVCAVKAYLRPQCLKIKKKLKLRLETRKQSKVNGIKKPNKLFYSWNEKEELVLYFKKGKQVELTEQESKLILCLKEDRKTQEEIIEHIWEVHKSLDIKKKKPNLGEIRGRINTKCRKIVATDLISELTDGYYSLKVGVEEQ